MKIKELRSMSKEDLSSKLLELKKELVKQNAQIATGTTPKSPGQLREIKKTIAKILTIASEQEKKSPKKEPKKGSNEKPKEELNG